jgi:hypothetical protein
VWSIALLSFLAGALWARRFNAFALVPALGIALPLAALIGRARGEGIGSLIADMVVIAACVEAGYVAWLVARAFTDTTPADETQCRSPARAAQSAERLRVGAAPRALLPTLHDAPVERNSL